MYKRHRKPEAQSIKRQKDLRKKNVEYSSDENLAHYLALKSMLSNIRIGISENIGCKRLMIRFSIYFSDYLSLHVFYLTLNLKVEIKAILNQGRLLFEDYHFEDLFHSSYFENNQRFPSSILQSDSNTDAA